MCQLSTAAFINSYSFSSLRMEVECIALYMEIEIRVVCYFEHKPQCCIMVVSQCSLRTLAVRDWWGAVYMYVGEKAPSPLLHQQSHSSRALRFLT